MSIPFSAFAGLYNTSEKNQQIRNTDYRIFQEIRNQLRSITINKIQIKGKYVIYDSPLRQRALLAAGLFDPMALRRGALKLQPEECLNGSAYLMRLGKYDEAKDLLQDTAASHPDDFLLASNLGMAWQLNGRQRFALRYLEQAQAKWPKDYKSLSPKLKSRLERIGWNKDRYDWFRLVEEYHFKLVDRGFNADIPEFAGAVFSKDGKPLRFVGDDGKYQPGGLAQSERDILPKDYLRIAQQLYVWFANDPNMERKMLWLVGELYNVRGGKSNAGIAYKILDEMVYARSESNPVVREHRRALKMFLLEMEKPKGAKTSKNPPPKKNTETKVEEKNGNGNSWDTSWWRMLAIGFGIGVVVGSLGFWQMWVLFGRRR